MSDARFLTNNSVTGDVNQVKLKIFVQDSWAHKSPTIIEIGQRIPPCGASLYQKVEIFAILGAVFPPSGTN